MLVSYKWIKEYLGDQTPSVSDLVQNLTLKSFEIEAVEEKDGDHIIDIKVMPDRNHDCLAVLGVVREIVAVCNIDVSKTNLPSNTFYQNYLNLRSVSDPQKDFDSDFQVKVETDKCERYIGLEVKGVVVKESPEEIKSKLASLGQRSINNIVDITNLIMFELGQPMHAFDVSKLDGKTIFVKQAVSGEIFETLDGKKVPLNEKIMVIADEKESLAIAGIKGGKKAEVDQQTKDILLEAACFNPSLVRTTSVNVGIKTDSSKRFENGITPFLAKLAISRAVELIKRYASHSETNFGQILDVFPKPQHPYKLGFSLREISSIAGIEISEKIVESSLDKLGYKFEYVESKKNFVEIAKTFLGKPYLYGASVLRNRDCFDCSSLVTVSALESGKQIPRISIDQKVFAKSITESELESGDLVFANTQDGTIRTESVEFLSGTQVPEGVDHVGIYIGDGKILHSSRKLEKGTEIENLKEAKQFANITGYGRILEKDEKRYVVEIPDTRLDMRLRPDLMEEVLRVWGYENIKERTLEENTEKINFESKINQEYSFVNDIRLAFADLGFSELISYTFVSKGELETMNPVAEGREFLRSNLNTELLNLVPKNTRNLDLVGMKSLQIFEIGKVFYKNDEKWHLSFVVASEQGKSNKNTKVKIEETKKIIESLCGQKVKVYFENDLIVEYDISECVSEYNSSEYKRLPEKGNRFKPLSQYPFIVRDIAMWVPENINENEVAETLEKNATDLLQKITLFDVFTKTFEDGSKKTSYAFRLVFQSYEKTLSDEEINPIMEKINLEVTQKQWQVR